MKKYSWLLLLAGMLLSSGLVFSQQLKFNQVLGNKTFELGYEQVITQDQKGYIWFTGVNKGLHRYDGKKTTLFSHNPDNTNSLASNLAIALAADSAGNIWTGTIGYGVDRFNPETKKFTHFRHSPTDPKSLSNDTVTAILTDRSGNIWIGTTRAVDKFDPATGIFTHYIINELASYVSSADNVAGITTLFEDSKGHLWTGWTEFTGKIKKDGMGGLARLDQATGKFIQYKHDPGNPNSLATNNLYPQYQHTKGNISVPTTANGLQILDRVSGKFSNYQFDAANLDKPSSPPVSGGQNDFTSFITEDVKGRLWIGSMTNGINMYDPFLKRTVHFGRVSNDITNRYAKDTLTGFTDSSALRAFTSKDGLLWIVSRSKGIYNIDFSSTTVPYTPLNASASSFYFEEEKNMLWINSDSGLIRKNVLTGEQKLIRQDPRNPTSFLSKEVMSMVGDGEGNIWLANHFNGVDKFSIKTEQITHYKHDKNNPASLVHDTTHILFFDREHYLWIGTHKGLSRMDPKTGVCTNYTHNPKDSFGISKSHINDIVQEKNGRIWLATDNEIFALDIKTEKFQRYELSGGQIVNVCIDAAGIIWANCGGILFSFDQVKNKFKKFVTEIYPGGFDNVLGLIEDNKGNLWVSTNRSIIKLNSKRDAATIFGTAQGVQSSTELWLRNFKAKDGRLYLGSNKGYYSFKPDELKDERRPPILSFSSFKIGNQVVLAEDGTVLTEPIWKTSNIKLNYSQNTISFEFGAIDYESPGNITYLYKLENYDEEWRDLGTETQATFFNLPPGNYTLHVKAINSDGAVVSKSIAIDITPPWWKTWWAYIFYGLLVILAGYLIYKYQKNYIVKRERERTQQKELAQAREIEKAYTQLKSTQAQLIQSEKMASLGELTAGIAHEIQNPLNFVNNFSEVNTELISELMEEVDKGNTAEVKSIATDIRENSEKIVHHGKRADAIVKGMLQHSRSSSNQKEPTDINALADEYLRLAYHGLRAKDKSFNATMHTDYDASIGNIHIVPQDIGRVILNLITNAFYVVNEKRALRQAQGDNFEPVVSVSTWKIDKKVEIKVADNGNGIPQKVLDKIFQPFFTTKPAGQGTGLGLSLSYDIVKAHGGELKVETKEGEGSTFIIQLPDSLS